MVDAKNVRGIQDEIHVKFDNKTDQQKLAELVKRNNDLVKSLATYAGGQISPIGMALTAMEARLDVLTSVVVDMNGSDERVRFEIKVAQSMQERLKSLVAQARAASLQQGVSRRNGLIVPG